MIPGFSFVLAALIIISGCKRNIDALVQGHPVYESALSEFLGDVIARGFLDWKVKKKQLWMT